MSSGRIPVQVTILLTFPGCSFSVSSRRHNLTSRFWSSGSYSLSSHCSKMFLEPWGQEMYYVVDGSTRAEHSMITCFLPFSQVWFSIIVCREKLLWWEMRATLNGGTLMCVQSWAIALEPTKQNKTEKKDRRKQRDKGHHKKTYRIN